MRVPKLRKHHRGSAFVEWQGERIALQAKYGTAKARENYQRFLAEHVYPTMDGTPPTQAGTIRDLLAAYLAHAESYYGRASSQFGHFRALASLLLENDRTPIAQFGPLAVRQVREAMIGKGWSRSYINDQVNRLRRMFRWAVANELCRPETLAALLAVEPLRKGKTPARETKAVQAIDWAIVERTLPYLSPTVADMVRVQHLTGARSSEVCALRPADIDRTGEVWVYRPTRHKTQWRGKLKCIMLGPQAQAILAARTPADPNDHYFRPADSIREHRKRRSSRPPRATRGLRSWHPRYNARSYRQAIVHAIRAANKAGKALPHWHPHQLRHTRATVTRKAFGVEGAASVTGNTLSAAQIYAERDASFAWRIALETG